MDNQAVIERIVKNLAFEVKALPKDEEIGSPSLITNSKNTPMNVKIRVKKDCVPHGVTRDPKENESVTQKTRIVNSDHTILSFDVSMEKFQKKPVKKSRRKIMDKLKPGLCLGASEDEDYQYLPSSSHNNKTNDENKFSQVSRQKFSLSKNPLSDNYSLIKRRRGILGNCKPGGCLDPPYGEDIYSYERDHKGAPNNVVNIEKLENDTRLKKSSTFGSDIFKRNKKEDIPVVPYTLDPHTRKGSPNSDISQSHEKTESIALDITRSNSVITYPPILMPNNMPLNKHSRKTSENKSEKSMNMYNNSYYIPQSKNTEKKLSDLTGVLENETSQNIPLKISDQLLGLENKLEYKNMTATDNDKIINYKEAITTENPSMFSTQKNAENNKIQHHATKSPLENNIVDIPDQTATTVINTESSTIMPDKKIIFIHDHKLKTPSQSVSLKLLKSDESSSNFTEDTMSITDSSYNHDLYNEVNHKEHETYIPVNDLTSPVSPNILKDTKNHENRSSRMLQQNASSISTSDTYSHKLVSGKDETLKMPLSTLAPLSLIGEFSKTSNDQESSKVNLPGSKDYENKNINYGIATAKNSIARTDVDNDRSPMSQDFRLSHKECAILEPRKDQERYKQNNAKVFSTKPDAQINFDLGSKDSLSEISKDIQHEVLTSEIIHHHSNESLKRVSIDFSKDNKENEFGNSIKSSTGSSHVVLKNNKVIQKSDSKSIKQIKLFDSGNQEQNKSEQDLEITILPQNNRSILSNEDTDPDSIDVQYLPEDVDPKGLIRSIKAEFHENTYLPAVSDKPSSEKSSEVDFKQRQANTDTEYKNEHDNYHSPHSHQTLKNHYVGPININMSVDSEKVSVAEPEMYYHRANEHIASTISETRNNDITSSLVDTRETADDSTRKLSSNSTSQIGVLSDSQIIIAQQKQSDRNNLGNTEYPKKTHRNIDSLLSSDLEINLNTNNSYVKNIDVDKNETSNYQTELKSKKSPQIDWQTDNVNQGAIKAALRTGESDLGLSFDTSKKTSLLSTEKADIIKATVSDIDKYDHTGMYDINTKHGSVLNHNKSAIDNKKSYTGSISVPSNSTFKSDLKSDTINLDFAIQSFINDEKETVLKTFDSTREPTRYRHDSITVVQSQIRLLSNEIRFPVDTQHDVLIQIRKAMEDQDKHLDKIDIAPITNNVEFKMNDGHEENLQITSNPKLYHQQLGSEVTRHNLSDIYNNELVPLYTVIRIIKKEVDYLAKQQTQFKEKVYRQRKIGRACRLTQTNRRCGCLKKR